MGIHILRKDQYNDCSIAFSWAPGGTGKRGRLKTTWRRTVKKEREESGWRSWAEARVAAVEALCATTCTRHEAVRHNVPWKISKEIHVEVQHWQFHQMQAIS